MSDVQSTSTESRLDLLATQYRESPNLKALIGVYLDAAGELTPAICETFDRDIDTAIGDQLTQLGKILGWDRVQCGGVRPRVFGFECVDDCSTNTITIGGFCDPWLGEDCNAETLFGEFTFSDDELYRRFLKSLILKYDNDFRRSTLREAVEILFGSAATIYNETAGTVEIYAGRALSLDEQAVAHLIKQVLPIAPGVGVSVYEGQGKWERYRSKRGGPTLPSALV